MMSFKRDIIVLISFSNSFCFNFFSGKYCIFTVAVASNTLTKITNKHTIPAAYYLLRKYAIRNV